MPPNDLPPTTSATQLSTYAMCPRKYEHRYILHVEPEYRSPNLALGSAFHSAVQWWFIERLQGREPTIEAAVAMAHTDLDAALAAGPVRWGKSSPEKGHDEVARLVAFFLVAKGDLEVVETEVGFEIPVIDPVTGEVMPRMLIGYFDAVIKSGAVVELKTSRSMFSDTEFRCNLQFAAYRAAARYAGVNVEVIAIIKNKTPRLQHVVLTPDADVSMWLMTAASQIERAIAAGHFPPASGRMCAGCEYAGACLGAVVEEVADAEAA